MSGASRDPALLVEDVSKTFTIPHEKRSTLKERVLHPRRSGADRLRALDGVSFSVERGEFFGVVGRNGSGKSTLLKCLAGIYGVDGGRLYVDGRVAPFIELGVGFHPELPARDNVVVNGILLGLTPREARRRFERVIEFAELEPFVDMKLKNYSSGMYVRLAFAVMIQVDADVLLIDEILAVGDAAFQQKCFDVFFELRNQGKTIVFVTHDMASVERFCHRAVLLDRGRIDTIGAPRAVADRYLRLNFERWRGERGSASEPRAGDGAARVVEAWVEDEGGARETALQQGGDCTFKALVRFERAVVDPSFAVAFVNESRQNAFVASSATSVGRSGRYEAGETVVFSVSFNNALAPGRYALSTLIARPGAGEAVIDRWEGILTVLVVGARAAGGLVDLPHELRLERAPASLARDRA